MQQAREISVTLRVERMRHGVLAVEVKRSLAIGSELYDAVSGQAGGQPRLTEHRCSDAGTGRSARLRAIDEFLAVDSSPIK